MKLLSKNAEDRYQGSLGIKTDLLECREQLEAFGKIEPFALARQDIPERFHIPEKLYGRHEEIETLVEAFERVLRGGKEMMLVTGRPGIGKTSLVSEIYKPVTAHRGHFISGKFDQFQRNIPYSALVGAFGDLVQQILTESEERLSEWRTKLAAALGPNGQVIMDVIPEVGKIVGPQPTVPDLGPIEAQNRFSHTFQQFIGVFCGSDHPLVLFLDDLQWADSASLRLVEEMMTDRRTQFLFLVGAYRDNEVGPTHPLMMTVDSVRKDGAVVNRIGLDALNREHVADLAADAFRSDKEAVAPLADLTHEKTRGNPFFVKEFLKTLYVDGLLEPDSRHGVWCWDVEQIRQREVTDNVIELMASKIRKLNADTQHVLKLAACIGNRFDLETLALVSGTPQKDTVKSLAQTVDEGLVIPLGDGFKSIELDVPGLCEGSEVVYKFCHDRIQQAAYSIVAETERPTVHRHIGQTLLRHLPPLVQEKRIFDVVNQLNQGAELIVEQSEKYQLAKLNLAAAKKAKASAAFAQSFDSLKAGLALLDQGSWQKSYDLTLAVHVEAVEAAYVAGSWDEMERLASDVMKNARTVLDKVPAYDVRIRAYLAQHDNQKSIQVGLEVLDILGVRFPKNPKDSMMLGLQETNSALEGREIEDLFELPQMTDPDKLAVMRILTNMGIPIYSAAPTLFPFLVFNQVRLSVKHGNAPQSPFGYACFAVILSSVVGDIDAGYRYGQLALRLVDRLDIKQIKAKTLVTVNYFSRHWKEHFGNTLSSFVQGCQIGLETGDLEWAALGACVHGVMSFWVGNELAEVEQGIADYNEAIARMKQDSRLDFGRRNQQLVLNLMARSEDPRRLIGDAYNVETMLPRYLESREIISMFIVNLYHLYLCYMFGSHSEAVEHGLHFCHFVSRH